MILEYANNRPVWMNPKHPTPAKNWDCGVDVGVVRIMEGQTEDGSCEATHPHRNTQKAKIRFRRVKKCHTQSGILRSDDQEGDKHYEDF